MYVYIKRKEREKGGIKYYEEIYIYICKNPTNLSHITH